MPSITNFLHCMARNNAWSNHRLLNACTLLTQHEFEAKRTRFFPSIQLTLNHILIVDWYYLDALEAGGRGSSIFENELPCTTIAELRSAQSKADTQLVRHCDSLSDVCVTAEIVLDRGGGVRRTDQVCRVLAHLFVHQIHHRGQVHAMLSGTDCQPPQLDEFFLKDDAVFRVDDLLVLGFSEEEINPVNFRTDSGGS